MADGLPSAAQVQQALGRVYARPEFQPPQRSGWSEWLLRQLGRVLHWIGERLDWLRGLQQTAPVVFWLIIAWLVITLVALLGHLVWTAVKVARMGEDLPTPGAGPARQKPRSAADWEAEAARLAAEGRLREAAAALYQSLLLRLDGLGVVRFDSSKTPGDYRREARKHPEAAQVLGGFLRLFEPVAFGGRDLDAEGWERLRAAAAQGGARA
ncbi:MAG TPA: DUF4129 domain-containing protein [Longimicrobium sp.]|nr:DUF4129 domain-containing protein [Longimicrobium sp.]